MCRFSARWRRRVIRRLRITRWGRGLSVVMTGCLEVTDPTQAYLQVAADGSSEYVRIVPVSDEVMGGVPAGSRVLRTVRVRADADRVAGSLCSVSLDSSRFVVCEGCGRSYGARAGGGAEGVIDSV